MARKLTVDDIEDLRAYEAKREEYRASIIALKRDRRVQVGELVTLVFENAETMRFQVQEMARAERMASDDLIQAELDTYNPLIPGPGELSATLFLELRSEAELREWLPRLVGIERSVQLVAGEGDAQVVVDCEPEEGHAQNLTREAITASVHYVKWKLGPDVIHQLGRGPAKLVVAHPDYAEEAPIPERTLRSLMADLVGE